jgi:hypothetical protein
VDRAWVLAQCADHILYSATDPQTVTFGGSGMRALSEAAGAIFFALGVLIALTAGWILVWGLAGCCGIEPIRPFDQ